MTRSADELVDLVREVEDARGQLTYPYTLDGGERIDYAAVLSDGRPAALDYAIVELLVEIRDLLRGVRS